MWVCREALALPADVGLWASPREYCRVPVAPREYCDFDHLIGKDHDWRRRASFKAVAERIWYSATLGFDKAHPAERFCQPLVPTHWLGHQIRQLQLQERGDGTRPPT